MIRVPMSSVALAPTVASFTFAPNLGAAEAWTRFRGPNGLGTMRNASVPTRWSDRENIVWKRDLPGRGASSPVWHGDRIYLTYFEGKAPDDIERYLACLKLDGGKPLWKKKVPSRLPEEAW